MSLFSKKEKIPEIPSPPEIPRIDFDGIEAQISSNKVQDLPSIPGDTRDKLNREIIKSAVGDSSEKKGDASEDNSSESSQKSKLPLMGTLPLPPPPLNDKPQPLNFAQPPKKVNYYPPRINRVEALKIISSAPREEMSVAPENASDLKEQGEGIGDESIPPLPEVDNFETSILEETSAKRIPSLPVQTDLPVESSVKRDAEETIFVRIDKFNSAKRDLSEIGRDLREIEDVLGKIEEIKSREDEEVAEISKLMEEMKLKINRVDSDIFNRI